MSNVFNRVMQVFSTLLGLAVICFGSIWVLQGLNIAFLVGPMVGDPQWVLWGTLFALFGVGQIYWSVTRKR